MGTKVKKKDEKAEALKTNPRVIREVGLWQTLKIMVEDAAVDRAWRVELYRWHGRGFFSNDQREAGDRYHVLVDDHRRFQERDAICELDLKRAQTLKDRYREAIKLLGIGRSAVDALVLGNEYLTERERYIARDGLQLLANFFGLSKNKVRTG